MRILRIATSNDDQTPVPEGQRAWKIAETMLAQAVGEPVETVLRRGWPNEKFPGRLEAWIEELEPDFVLIQVNNYWYGHESIPLWFDRRLGRAGRSLGSAGAKLGKWSWVADNRWAQLAIRRAPDFLPYATHFSIAEVASCMELALRKVLAHEGVILLVRGNEDWPIPTASGRFNRRNHTRNLAMSAAMKDVCDRLRVPYAQRPSLTASEITTLNGAGFHSTADEQRKAGEFDGAAMIAAWRSAHPVARA